MSDQSKDQNAKSQSQSQQVKEDQDATAKKGVPKVKSPSEAIKFGAQKAFQGGAPGFLAMGIQGKEKVTRRRDRTYNPILCSL